LEALSEGAQVTKNPLLLTEYVRQAIRRMVVRPYLNRNGELPALLLDAALDQAVESAVEHGEHTSHLNLPPQRIQEMLGRLTKAAGNTETPVVVLTSSGARYFVRQIAESSLRNLVVISHGEIPAGVKVVSLGIIQ
jgi:flagellar biosynthesis protein FlhA